MPDSRSKQPASAVSSTTSLLAGSASGLIVAAGTQPLDVARTMLQRDPKHNNHVLTLSTWTSWNNIARSDGVTALWRGNVPSMLRVGFGAGL